MWLIDCHISLNKLYIQFKVYGSQFSDRKCVHTTDSHCFIISVGRITQSKELDQMHPNGLGHNLKASSLF